MSFGLRLIRKFKKMSHCSRLLKKDICGYIYKVSASGKKLKKSKKSVDFCKRI